MDEKILDLYKDLPKEAEQFTLSKDTKKGYDTSGYGYQWCVDRLNEVYGLDWSFEWEIINHDKGEYRSGTPYHELTVTVTIYIEDKKGRSCVGGHISVTFYDALKGAITSGFKKTVSFFGVGAKAYRGEVDDDHKPLPGTHKDKEVLAANEEMKAELNKLPENIKEGLRMLNYGVKAAFTFCDKFGFEPDKILKEINLILDSREDSK